MIKIHRSAIVIISLSLFIFVAYNVMTVEAAPPPLLDKEKQKSMCEVDYEAEWKDGSCHFSGKEKNFDESEYLMDLKDEGVYDDYLARNDFIKEKHIKELVNNNYNIDRETADYYCDASEDYVKNKEGCDKLYDKAEKAEESSEE